MLVKMEYVVIGSSGYHDNRSASYLPRGGGVDQ